MRFALFRRGASEPAHLEVSHDGHVFRVGVRRRANARRMTLRVSNATGEVALTVPERTDLDAARRFARAHAGWIAARLARIPPRVAFEADAEIPLRGVPRRIVHRPELQASVEAVTDPDGQALIAVSVEPARLARAVRTFLAREARRDLAHCVGRHTAALGLAPRPIAVRDTRSRWGSCSSHGSLSFSWRLILAPPFVLDYLAAHEVAHLRELNHSQRFWRIVQGLCPRTDEAERWLKRHGADLHRYG